MNLTEHNTRVRAWADRQPLQYRLSALAFGYPADTETCKHSFTLAKLSRMSRRRRGQGVSRSTLAAHLAVFKASGVIKAEKRRGASGRQGPNVYTIDFTKAISEATAGDDGWLEASIERTFTGQQAPQCGCWWCQQGKPESCFFGRVPESSPESSQSPTCE
jgi:hypothetical protein